MSVRTVNQVGLSRKFTTGWLIATILLLWIGLGIAFRGRYTLQLAAAEQTPIQKSFGAWAESLDADRNSNPLFVYLLNPIRRFVDGFVHLIQAVLSTPLEGSKIPLLGWLGALALLTLLVYITSNLKTAIFAGSALFACGALGLWRPTMDTLALTFASVILSLAIGIPLGIWAGLSDRVLKLFTPILDFAQIMPTFVYLTPLTLFFLIGPASATIATMIYAIPPAIRITAFGIRNVPVTSIEAGTSMGATKKQLLTKVQLPLSKQTITVGVNQTIMAAVSFVTIAALIDAPGLGKNIIQALQVLDVGKGLVAGIAIVLIAIVLDRSTSAASKTGSTYAPPSEVQLRKRRMGIAIALSLTVISIFLSRQLLWAAVFPENLNISGPLSDATNSIILWVKENLYFITDGFKNLITTVFINPLQWILENTPWFFTLGMLVAVAFIIGGLRVSVIVCLNFSLIVVIGLWEDTMVTLAQTLIASLITIGLGIAIGVYIARNPRAEKIIRPFLDAGQTLPAFVFLVPLLGLFGPTRFTAIMAAIIYASPVVVKIVADGIKSVPIAMTEAATASGVTNRQMIFKVQLPASRKALVLAANQGLIFVLAMVVVGGLVGGGALGYDVINGFAQLQLKGKGLAAGLAIVFMGIALDRITQSSSRRNSPVKT
jgi:glycine betaine/proline transport system permease protein